MAYLQDISNSSNAAKNVALEKRISGKNGHTALGAILTSNINSIFSFGVDVANGKYKQTEEPKTEADTTTENSITTTTEYNSLKKKFYEYPTEENYKNLKNFLEENDNINTKYKGSYLETKMEQFEKENKLA